MDFPRRLWFALAMMVMMGSAQAIRPRTLQKEDMEPPRLQAYNHPGCDEARHAPAVKSFLVSDGSWVDCVPIEGQISAHHPALKDHVIQTAPPARGERISGRHPQLFAQEHGGCPEGSIPVLRDNPAGNFIKKTAPPSLRRHAGDATEGHIEMTTDHTEELTGDAAKHEYAITGVPNSARGYSGTKSVFSVNAPTLGLTRDMSLSQFWIVDGSYSDKSLSTIEVGWQTQPNLHPGDNPNAPHLFIFWTNNAYGNTGPGTCYDLKCPGFVQYSRTWVMGGVMPHYTTLAQHALSESEVTIEVWFYAAGNSWWLYLDNEAIGYWPKSIYANGKMQGAANQVQWGGEVAFQQPGSGATPHSMTAMGSGAFPSANWPTAAYQRNITYFDGSGVRRDPGSITLNNNRQFDNPVCYDIQVQLSGYGNWGTYFFFGGPGGGNSNCHY